MFYRYKTHQWIPYPIELVFSFFADPRNLPPLLKPWQRARLEEAAIVPPPPRPLTPDPAHRLRTVAAGSGSVVTISFRPFPWSPVRLPWEARITGFTWNHSFTNLATRSPFSRWEHTHLFEVETRANDAGLIVQGTLLRDEVEYQPPGYSRFARLLHREIYHRIVKSAFEERQRRLVKILPQALGRIVPLPPEE